MKCIEREIVFGNARFHVVVYTSSSSVCNEVAEAESQEITGILEFIKRHGGCHVESENPLKISSGDKSTLVEVEPVNAAARMLWITVIKKTREYCK